MSVDEAVPDWLQQIEQPPTPVNRKPVRVLQRHIFEIAFESVLERIYSGMTLAAALREDHREIPQGAFTQWINSDPERSRRYKEAKEIRTEAWAGQMIEYAQGLDGVEDVNRSKLKVDVLKYLMGADNRKVYGDTKSIELGGTISVSAALQAAQQRLVNDIVDMEVIEDQSGDRGTSEDDN